MKDPETWRNFFQLNQAPKSKIVVTEDTALRLSAVFACVRVLSETVASLPLSVYERTDRGKRMAGDHPIYFLVHNQPNQLMTSYKFRETIMKCLLLNGNAYIRIVRNGAGIPTQLILELPEDVGIYRNGQELTYLIRGGTYDNEDVIHIRGLGDGIIGLSPIAYARENIGLGLAAEQFGAGFFGNGANMSGVLETPGKLSDAQKQFLSEQWNKKYSGVDNAHSTAILEGGLKYNRISIAPEDAQFIETRKFQKNEIATLFNVPPPLIQDLEKATFSNIEHQDIFYMKYSIRPYVTNIESEFNSKLFIGADRQRYFVEHNMNAMMRGDHASRSQYYREMWNIGAITHNQILSLENMNGYEGGDRRFVPVNMMPADLVDQHYNQQNNENGNPEQ